MIRRVIVAALVVCASACSNQAGPAPCASDANCPTGSYCGTGGKCAALPDSFSVTLAQSTATVTVGSTFQFSVTSVGGVTWSVQETFGGTIDPNGTYHAPTTPGTYHVVATSISDSTKSATATVTTVPAPSAAIDVPNILTRGKTGISAQVPTATGLTYAWHVSGGTLTSAGDGNQITFTAGTGASMLVAVTVTNVASSAASNAVTITLVDPPVAPTITAAQTVTAGKAGLSASIAPLAGLSYAWSVTHGTITSGAATDAITYVSGSGSILTLSCTATNAAGDSATATFNEALVPAPAQAQISAPLQLTQGAAGTAQVTNIDSSLTYQWTISGGTFTDASAGANGTTDTGTAVSYTASASANIATLSCVATNAAGVVATAGTANINLVAPSAAAIAAPATVTANKAGYTASVVAQSGASYAWTITGGTITSAANLSSITFTAGSGTPPTLTLSCMVTNSAGTPASASLNLAVAPVPVAPVISTAAKVTQGNNNVTASVSNASASFTYNWSITGGTFNGSVPSSTASGNQVSYTAGTGTTLQLTCTAVNAAGDSLASSFAATLIVPPLAPTFSGAKTVSQGYSSSASVANVPSPNTGNAQLSYQWSISGGTLTSAANTTQVTYSAGNGTSLNLTCTATNVAGDSAQSTLAVTLVPAPQTPGITAPQYLSVNKTVALALTNAQANTSYAWTVSNAGTAGYIDPNNGSNIIATASGTAPTFAAGANPGSPVVHVTATNAAGDTESANATIQVVAIPATPSVSITSPNAGYSGYLTQGKQNVSATITNPVTDGSVTYQWTISGGGFTSGNATAAGYPVSFNAGYGASVALTATAYNKANDPSQSASASDTLVALAGAPTLSAAKALISAGVSGQAASIQTPVSGQTYYWTITHGTFDGTGGSTSTSGTSVLFTAATGATQVTLGAYVLNQAGDPGTSGSIAISVVPAPLTPSFSGAQTVSGGKTSLSASVGNQQTGESYVWTMSGNGTINGSTVASDGSTTETSNSIAYTSGSPGQITIAIKGTNQAGDSASSTTTVTVVPAPAGAIAVKTQGGTAMSAVTTGNTYVGTVTLASGQGTTTYAWTVGDNGSVLGTSGTTSQAYFVAGNTTVGQLGDGGSAAPMRVTCTITNAAGDTAAIYTDLPVYPVANATINVPGQSGPQDAGVYNGYYLVGAWTMGNTISVIAQAGAVYSWSLGSPFSTVAPLNQNVLAFSALASWPTGGAIYLTVTNGAGDSSTSNSTLLYIVAVPYPTPLEVSPYYLSSADGGPLGAPSVTFSGYTFARPLEREFLAGAGSAPFPGGASSAVGDGVLLSTTATSSGSALVEDPLWAADGGYLWQTQPIQYSVTPVHLDAGLELVAGAWGASHASVDGTGQSARLSSVSLSVARDGGPIFLADVSVFGETLREIVPDGGQWSAVTLANRFYGLNAIAAVDGTHVFGCSGGTSCWLISAPGGWASSNVSTVGSFPYLDGIYSMNAVDANTVFASTGSELFRFVYNGSSWTASTIPSKGAPWLAIHATDVNNAWAVACKSNPCSNAGDSIYQLQYDGGSKTWSEFLVGGGNAYNDIDGPAAQANFTNAIGIDALDSSHLIIGETGALRLVTLGDGGANSSTVVSTLPLAGQVPYGQGLNASLLAVVDGGVLWGDPNALYFVTNPEGPTPAAHQVLGLEPRWTNQAGTGPAASLYQPGSIVSLGSIGNLVSLGGDWQMVLVTADPSTGGWDAARMSGPPPGSGNITPNSIGAISLADGSIAVVGADTSDDVWLASVATSGCPAGATPPCWINGSVIAGSDTAGTSDGLGTSASFYYPRALGVADSSTILVGDQNSLRLMQNNLPGTSGWTVTTLTQGGMSQYCYGDGPATGSGDTTYAIGGAVANGVYDFYYTSTQCGTLRLLSNAGGSWNITTLRDASGNPISIGNPYDSVLYTANAQTLYLAPGLAGSAPPTIQKCTEATLGGPWSCSTVWTSAGMIFQPGPLGTASMMQIGGMVPFGPNQLLVTDYGENVIGLLQYQ